MIEYTAERFNQDITSLAKQISDRPNWLSLDSIYGIPRGGIPVAIALGHKLGLPLVDREEVSMSTLIVDDLIDSGNTLTKWRGHQTAVLHRKPHSPPMKDAEHFFVQQIPNEWITYFWEKNEPTGEDIVVRLLQLTGEDPTREGLLETPKRFIKAWEFYTQGYKQDPKDIMKCFDGDGYDQIVLLKDIELYSLCEHHLAPFWGKAHIAYIPDRKVLGVSKLARLMDIYSRRLQIQERLGDQVVKALMDYLQPKGAACIIEAAHLCMRMRGVQKQNSTMVTSSLAGVFMTDNKAREELMRLIK